MRQDGITDSDIPFLHEQIENWTKHINNSVQTLDNRQYRTVLSEGRETKGEPYCCPSFLPGTLSRQLDRKENPRQSTELGRWGSEPERLRQLRLWAKFWRGGS